MYVWDTIVENQQQIEEEEAKLLEAVNRLPTPEILKEKLETKGLALKADNSSKFLPKIVQSIY